MVIQVLRWYGNLDSRSSYHLVFGQLMRYNSKAEDQLREIDFFA